MSDDQPPVAGTGSLLLLNSPLHELSLAVLIDRAIENQPRRVVDHGCGWGEVLLRTLAHATEATGTGVDVHGPDLDRARAAAANRGLNDRVNFVQGPSTEHREPADLVINLGAYEAFGDVPTALQMLRSDLLPGGRALLGVEYWAATPTPDELAHMWPDASVADCAYLPDLVETVHETGWRILDLHDSTRTEFDDFELGHLREREQWLVCHPEHPIRPELDQTWSSWLRGHRRPMGFTTLVLG